MSGAPFTTTLRTHGDGVRIGDDATPRLRFRVQWLDGWDAVRVEAPPETAVAEVKGRALAALAGAGADPAAFEVKLRGHEVADEGQSLAAAGVRDGSTLSVAYRRRRPVR